MNPNFTHLHLHTEYSLLDGIGKIAEYILQAKKLNMNAIAITDHGNMFGAFEFYKCAIKHGIKPIIGIEIYVAQDSMDKKEGEIFHLVLLAKNNIGYKNLLKLNSKAYLDGFYKKPRIDKNLLKKHSEGIIALSACMQGEISYYLLKDKFKEANNSLNDYLKIFTKENFYIEIQNTNISAQIKLNKQLYELAEKHNVETVITNDVHYVYKDDDVLQDIAICIQTSSKINDTKRMRIDTKELYLKDYEDMLKTFPDEKYKSSFDNTLKITNQCNVLLEYNTFKFPNYEIPANFRNPNEFLKYLVNLFSKKRYPEITNSIISRINFELKIIIEMGYATYFIVVWDLINYAKANEIPIGPGRGSAAGSIISYILGITQIDPIKYNLIFERFLNPERISMPDIDIDICQERRHEIVEYVTKKYGREHVAQIITFGTLKARAAIRDVGRVFGVQLSKIDKLAKLISFKMDLKTAIQSVDDIKKMYTQDLEIKKIIDFAIRLEGKVRHSSIHAAGIIISKKPIMDEIPLYTDSHKSFLATQYQMKAVEEIGLLKMDFLGLKNLTIIKRTLNYIKKYHNLNLKLENIPLDDLKTYNVFQTGNTLGVFQFESTGITNITQKIAPDKFEDIIAILALYRPGPLTSGMVDDFINSKKGNIKIKYPHQILKPILEETYGVILYQEQVMKIANTMANYSLGEADILRRAMGKKVIEIMENNREMFISRSLKNGFDDKIANYIFDLIQKFAGYGFNKSHSASYAMISYWTAYLKANYSLEFYAALMTSEHDVEKTSRYIKNAKQNNLNISLPNVNLSDKNFTVKNSKILFGLASILNIGELFAEKLIDEREKNGLFSSYENFVYRAKKIGINKKALEALIFAGALDDFKFNRREMYESIDKILEYSLKQINKENDLQLSLFGKKIISNNFSMEKFNKLAIDEKLRGEKEFLGLYFSAHPLDKYKTLFDIYPFNSLTQVIQEKINSGIFLGIISSINRIVTKRGQVMAILDLEDFTKKIKVLIFPQEYTKYNHLLINGEIIIAQCEVTIDTFKEIEEKKLIVKSISDLTHILLNKNQKLYILIDEKNHVKIDKLKKILKKHSGSTSVFIALKEYEKKSLIKLPEQLSITISLNLINDIQSLLGKNTIKLK